MPASFTFNGQSNAIPLGRQAVVVAVFAYDAGADSEDAYTFLPNVRCLSVQWREGADPGVARFRYAFGSPYDDGKSPTRLTQVYPLNSTSPRVVENDDRLVVRAYFSDGSYDVVFDGFALLPEGYLDAKVEAVTFVAMGTPVRCWDKALGGAVMRDATEPKGTGAGETKTYTDVPTNLPARFNPDGHPNASPDGADAGPSSGKYPTFLGPVWPPNAIDTKNDGKPLCQLNGATLRTWTLGMAARYVICNGLGVVKSNGLPTIDQTYVQIGGLCTAGDDGKYPIDGQLQAITPKTPGGTVDLNDASTYKSEDIEVLDYDVTGECWPVALERLITPYGFALCFDLSTDSNGDPQWKLRIYRTDRNITVKSLYLQTPGSKLDPGQSNLGALKLARDATQIENAFTVYTAPTRYEASFVLAPGFQPDPKDATNPSQFKGNDISPYRTFVFDEIGEGHWDVIGQQWETDNYGDFTDVFEPPTKDGQGKEENGDQQPENDGTGQKKWVNRRRPGRGTLITRGANHRRLKATLDVSSDYDGTMPGVWDGESGKWQEVHSDDWELLPDRLGIRITADDPNAFKIGIPALTKTAAYAGSATSAGSPGVLKLVEWIAAPTDAFPSPRFRLTCVIEDDQGLPITNDRRSASPTTFEIRRAADSRDRFKQTIVTRWSTFAPDRGKDGIDEIYDDDTDEAQAHADGLQRAHELGDFAGSATIPRYTAAYKIGDKVKQISGRDISLAQSASTEQDETPIYPSIVAISWEFNGKQETTLQLGDRRAEPPPKHRESNND